MSASARERVPEVQVQRAQGQAPLSPVHGARHLAEVCQVLRWRPVQEQVRV